MKVLVCGGRKYFDKESLFTVLDRLNIGHVVHGGAPGADSFADTWALWNKVEVTTYKADWQRYGKAAGPIRNERMLREAAPDAVVAFEGGAGTADMVRRALQAGVLCFRVVGTNVEIIQ